jgi:hypothetical protein
MKASTIFLGITIAFFVIAFVFWIFTSNTEHKTDLLNNNPRDLIFIVLLLQGCVFGLITVGISQLEKKSKKSATT